MILKNFQILFDGKDYAVILNNNHALKIDDILTVRKSKKMKIN